MRRWRAEEVAPPTNEYGQLTIAGAIENGVFFVGTDADGMDALDAFLARIGTIDDLVLTGGEAAFPRLPDMRHLSILNTGSGSVTLSGVTISDGVLRCDNLPVYWDTALGLQSCSLTSLTGDPADLFNMSESGTVDLTANELSSADVDAILVAAAALPQAAVASLTLMLNGGTMGVPGAAGQAALTTLNGYGGWTVYVNS